MSAPLIAGLTRGIESQYLDCLKVSNEAFFDKENVAKRVEAIKAKIALMSNKYELFYQLKIPASKMSDADFQGLDSYGRTTFLAGYLGQFNKNDLIAFFQPKTKHALAKL